LSSASSFLSAHLLWHLKYAQSLNPYHVRSSTQPQYRRHHNHHSEFLGTSFFIDWLRKPNLKLEALKNDPNNPPNPSGSGQVPSNIKFDFLAVFDKSTAFPQQHPSQSFVASFKTIDEPLDVLKNARIRLKFGVIKVTNLPRSVREMRFRGGNATDVTAYFSTRVSTEDGLKWLEAKRAVWYSEDWADTFNVEEGTKPYIEAIDNLRAVERNPLLLLDRYLKKGGTTYHALPVGHSAYLWLFFTDASTPNHFWTVAGALATIPSKGRVKLALTCNEDHGVHEEEWLIDIRSWNDFEIQPVTN